MVRESGKRAGESDCFNGSAEGLGYEDLCL